MGARHEFSPQSRALRENPRGRRPAGQGHLAERDHGLGKGTSAMAEITGILSWRNMFNNFFHILSSFCFSITTIFRTKSDNLHQLWAFLDGKNTLITPSFGDFSSYILTQTKWHHCDKMVTSDPLPQKKVGPKFFGTRRRRRPKSY